MVNLYCVDTVTVGLIHANHGLSIMDYLSKELRNTSEVSSTWSVYTISVETGHSLK